jgi:hypothetical protein
MTEEKPYDELDLKVYRVAKEARNMEIGLFWQRSNYFLVLSTAIAAGFFSLRDAKYALPLASFGLVVGWGGGQRLILRPYVNLVLYAD